MRYLKFFENFCQNIKKFEQISDNKLKNVIDCLLNFYKKFIIDSYLIKKIYCDSNMYAIEFKHYLVKITSQEIRFFRYTAELKTQAPEYLEIVNNIKLFFEFLLKDSIIKFDKVSFTVNLELAAEIILKNIDYINSITEKDLEMFGSAEKYNF